MKRIVAMLAVVLAVAGGVASLMRDKRDQSILVPSADSPSVEATTATDEAVGSSEAGNAGLRADRLVSVENRPIEVLTAGYVSAAECQRCHKDQHRSWHASFHRTMTQTISPDTAPAAIEDQQVRVSGVDYRFERRGQRYFVHFDDPMEPGPRPVAKELVLMTGSHHMHVFWYESPLGRTLALLPIVYLLEQERWIPRNSAFVRPPGDPGHEFGRWNQVCSRCHSTHPRGRYVESTGEWDTHVADFGIACEACHGPGLGHIRFHDGMPGAKAVDDVVVSPSHLSHQLQSDVCGQCHSVHRPKFDEYDRKQFLLTGMPFRPGDNLEDSPLRTLLRTTPQAAGTKEYARAAQESDTHHSFWPDGTVRVTGREYSALIESSCFQRGEMSCLSCHTMHPDESNDLNDWRDDQLKPGMRTNQACTQCHREPQYNDEVARHTHHEAGSHGSACMNCHMPHSTYGLLKSVRSHRIESPSVVTTLETGRPNGCVLCHLDRSLAWTADHLTQWYGHEQLELQNPIARETASGLVNLLLGDAGLRAIYSSAFSWQPAREASGTDWMAPYLALGLVDEYDAVRLIAKRTLRTLPGYEDIKIDEFADLQERAAWVSEQMERYNQEVQLTPRPELLIGEDGKVDFQRASEMFNARDRTPVFLQE